MRSFPPPATSGQCARRNTKCQKSIAQNTCWLPASCVCTYLTLQNTWIFPVSTQTEAFQLICKRFSGLKQPKHQRCLVSPENIILVFDYKSNPEDSKYDLNHNLKRKRRAERIIFLKIHLTFMHIWTFQFQMMITSPGSLLLVSIFKALHQSGTWTCYKEKLIRVWINVVRCDGTVVIDAVTNIRLVLTGLMF